MCPIKMGADRQRLTQALRELLQNSRYKQNQQTTSVAVHLIRELNCMDDEVSWRLHESRMLHVSFCINLKNMKSVETIKFWHASYLLARPPVGAHINFAIE